MKITMTKRNKRRRIKENERNSRDLNKIAD